MPKKPLAVSPEAARILRRVARRILEEPRRLEMSTWGRRRLHRAGACNTIGCIAGWTVLDGKTAAQVKAMPEEALAFTMETAREQATQKLGLTLWGTTRLFIPDQWPAQFVNIDGENPKGRSYAARAKTTAARIEHFIKTGE